MKKRIDNIYRLGIKELFSLRYDLFLVFLIVYFFTFGVYEGAQSGNTDVENASIAIVDEDRSIISNRIHDSLLEPYFKDPDLLSVNEIDQAMDRGLYSFVIDIPPDFQKDLLAGDQPEIQINVDATAMSIAGRGAGYIQNVISEELVEFLNRGDQVEAAGIVIRSRFNPNLEAAWFQSVMEIVNNITILAIILTGAAVIREREHGTIEHLLVMPLRPFEIMLAKIWANGLVVLVAVIFSLYIVVQGLLEVPISGSIPLFIAGTIVFLFSVTSLGILLATIARSMPQFGLLAIPVFLVMMMLSGVYTPMDSMPTVLRYIMYFSPSTHFVSFAQAVLFRDAGIDVVWWDFAKIFFIGAMFFTAALYRFRKSITAAQS
ncbi:MAG: ABC-2 transporter permease [Thermodesulfobacteriales bacterium]|jgi:ABC-2 type transport system permease protein|nr:MAG: ABC-2 transporter permease [Thermodesulfobacteriales bacterium]